MRAPMTGDKIQLHAFAFRGKDSTLNGRVAYIIEQRGELMGRRAFVVQFGNDNNDYVQARATEDQFEVIERVT